MGVFTKQVSLIDGLVTKSLELRVEQVAQEEASVSFIEASRRAEETAQIAAIHANAVEKAIDIINAAGVVL